MINEVAGSDNVTCPYCGTSQVDYMDLGDVQRRYDQSTGPLKWTCNSSACGKVFEISEVRVELIVTTRTVDHEHKKATK